MKAFVIPSIKRAVAPTANENLSAGYPIGQHWLDTATGKEYYHSSDGVWKELATTHEALPDKNSEDAFQHVDTTTIKSTLDEADKVALWDNVSGKVVLIPKSNLQLAFQEAFFEPELTTYISGLTTPISFANKQKINSLIKEIKNVCNITRLSDAFDAMYLFANETAECALRNMVKRAHDCTVVNSLAFTQYEGFISGSNKYLDTNYAPITQAVRFQQNSASIGAYGVSSVLYGNYRRLMQLDESDASYESIISISQVGTASFASTNSPTGTSLGANTSISAMVISSRTTASLHKAYWNGIYKGQSTVASVSIPATSGNFIIYDKASIGYSGKCAFAFIGKGLSDEQAFGVTMAIENYMDSNEKGII